MQSNNARFDKEKETAELMQTLTIGGAADVPVQVCPEGLALALLLPTNSIFALSCSLSHYFPLWSAVIR